MLWTPFQLVFVQICGLCQLLGCFFVFGLSSASILSFLHNYVYAESDAHIFIVLIKYIFHNCADLAKAIAEFKEPHKVLFLLRGFFFWLQVSQ